MYNILICDDDKDIVSALDIYLTSEGFATVKAYDGLECLAAVEQQQIDLILLDVMMPGLDGIRTTAKLRESCNVPIILLTAKSEDTDKILGLNIGADDYITKPFNPIEVIARVKSQLRRYTSLGGRSGPAPSPALLTNGGITMDDGTLVFPIQFIDETRIPNAGIMYSKDRGKTWAIHNHARTNTTEAQVAELEPGTLMLNMRDNRGGSRAVYTTDDLGKTWKEHESSRTSLIEPVCMASLISVKAKDNVLGKDLLIFSNPNTTNARKDITIKISLDGGKTWKPEHQLLLDEGYNWGYSCLTMIDKETIGILYESSVAHMTFQSIKLKDIIK